jgi:hypothetical protein
MKYFEKIDKDLLNNRNLNSHEKLIYIICYSFRNAPRGCRVSHKYLMQRTGIKTKKTLIKCLDNLSLYGLMSRMQIGQGTNHYVFDKDIMQSYIAQNIGRRKKLSLKKKSQFKSYMKNINDPKVIHIHKVIKDL